MGYKYSKEEQEFLKVLKIQDIDLREIVHNAAEHTRDIDSIKKDIENYKHNTTSGDEIYSNLHPTTNAEEIQVSPDSIPDWTPLIYRAEREIPYQPIIEDFLTKEEIRYTKDDIARIENEFSKKCKLSKTDRTFLMTATTLQTLRWVLIEVMGNIGKTIGSPHNEERHKLLPYKFGNKSEGKHNKRYSKGKAYPTWKDILQLPAPYDNINGKDKRSLMGIDDNFRALGHDPILGWIFGTANLLTDTITLSNWKSYRVSRKKLNKSVVKYTNSIISLPQIIYESYDSIKEDKLRLPAAIFAQYLHFDADKYKDIGLPTPMIEVFSERLKGKLYEEQYNQLHRLRGVKSVGTQAIVSAVINMIITLVHAMFYNEQIDGDRDLYEVRTRKILMYSSAMSSAGNIAYSVATSQWGKLDVGGVIVSITRLFSDTQFITRVKQEFIEKELDKNFETIQKIIDSYYKIFNTDEYE